jgi:molybdopterin-containing oxidoreductase family membrane subunit
MTPRPPEEIIRPEHPTAWAVALLVSLLAFGFGVWCFSQQLEHGEVVTNMGNPGYGGAAWGLYIAMMVYFIGIGFAGIAVSSIARLFGVESLRPATRVAQLLTIFCLIAGASCVVADLGRPLQGLLLLPRYARPQSPFFGTFSLVMASFLTANIIYFFLAARRDAAVMARTGPRRLRLVYRLLASGRQHTRAESVRHHRVTYWLAVGMLPLLVTALATEGFIFGIQAGRPGWYGTLQSPSFVVLAGVSGTGLVILALLGVRWLFGLADRIPAATVRWLGALMSVLSLVYLYFIVVEEMTATYAAPAADRKVAHAVTAGIFAPGFWLTVVFLLAAFAIPFVLYLRGKTSLGWLALAAGLANIAALFKRTLIVVPSQTHGALLPVQSGYYLPNMIEMGVVVGLFGMVATAILLVGRFFPLVPSDTILPGDPERGADSPRRHVARLAATGFTVTVALTMIVIGLADSFRLFSDGELDNRIPYSPLIFASGVITLFGSAIVYSVFPGPHAPPDEPEAPDVA